MITLLAGENNFELTHALEKIINDFTGEVERIDGSVIETRQLPDLLMGGTLFASKRVVIIKGLTENKTVWNDLIDWIPRVSDDVHLVLVEIKPDKRTKTYKDLSKAAEVKEFPAWTDRDTGKAEAWVGQEAQRQGFAIDKKSIQTLVDRVGVDQWQLFHALEKLSVLDAVTPDNIADVIEANPAENVFNLLDAALRHDRRRVMDMLRSLEQTDDPYMVFGLLSSQIFQLAALAVSDKPSSEVAKDIGAHPFALSKLSSQANKLGRNGARKAVTAFADADRAMKSTATDPWLQIERALMRLTV